MIVDVFIFILSIVLFPPMILVLFRLSDKIGREIIYAFIGFFIPVITWISLSPGVIVNGVGFDFFSFSLVPALLMMVFLLYYSYGPIPAKKAVFSILAVFIGTTFLLTIYLFVGIAYSGPPEMSSLLNSYLASLIALVSFLMGIFVAIYIMVFVFEYVMERSGSDRLLLSVFSGFTTAMVANGVFWPIVYRSLRFITGLQYAVISDVFQNLWVYVVSSSISAFFFSAFIYLHVRRS